MDEIAQKERDRDKTIQNAGNELDRLTVELKAKDGCSYVAAFRRICILHPGLARQYQTGQKD